jgi:hypothetical protein
MTTGGAKSCPFGCAASVSEMTKIEICFVMVSSPNIWNCGLRSSCRGLVAVVTNWQLATTAQSQGFCGKMMLTLGNVKRKYISNYAS